MGEWNVTGANRIGFAVIGLTNFTAFMVMLAAAYDLTSQFDRNESSLSTTPNLTVTQPYCNEQSTSVILLANTLPSLIIKLVYPYLFGSIPSNWKAIGAALLSAAAFLVTSFAANQFYILVGVACASLSVGLGESFFFSRTPLYGDSSLSGWAIGTGAAGLFGALAYTLLRTIISTRLIMLVMLINPAILLFAYFYLIKPLPQRGHPSPSGRGMSTLSTSEQQEKESSWVDLFECGLSSLSFIEKLQNLPCLAKYYFPLVLVYFAEYFINQGLFELIYFPEVSRLTHAAQYHWFNVSYQVGVLISRSSIELFQLRNIWVMSLLQFANTILFLLHTTKIIHLPSFYLVVAIIFYEGLLGGLTYVNTFYRLSKECQPPKKEFSISTVSTAEHLGIVLAGFTALPVHNLLCELYK